MNGSINKFTDSHCHFDFPEFDGDRHTIIQQCSQLNIHRMIIPAISPDNWEKVLNLTIKVNSDKSFSAQNFQLFACLGIHPWFLNNLNHEHLSQLARRVKEHKKTLIAIGETGIDGVIAKQENNLAQQQQFFEFQLQLAKQYHLPVIVHHRQSHQHIVSLIKHANLGRGGIIHAFSGSYQQAVEYIDLGFKLGVGATITYERAQKTIKTIKRIPLSSLVLETDAPAMPPAGLQGKINSPLNLPLMFQHLCNIRLEKPEQIAQQMECTINRLFFAAY